MNLAQIVVYRSPFDQWLWESGVAWYALYVVAALCGLCVVLSGLVWLQEGVSNWNRAQAQKKRKAAAAKSEIKVGLTDR